jgi:hypothetical protein
VGRVIELPECRKRRGGPEDDSTDSQRGHEFEMNGQVCHRIAAHHGDCLFDRPPEFDPIREEARPLPKPNPRLTRYSPVPMVMGSTWKDR